MKKTTRQVIGQTFASLKKDYRGHIYKLQNFQIIEVEIEIESDQIIVGIGVNHDYSQMIICRMRIDRKYESYDQNKWKKIFTIGIPDNCGRNEYLAVELENQCLISRENNFCVIYETLFIAEKISLLLNLFSKTNNSVPKLILEE